jgi:hypothetical protein
MHCILWIITIRMFMIYITANAMVHPTHITSSDHSYYLTHIHVSPSDC